MNLERYEYKTDREHTDYYFLSVGPKGIIMKAVRYVLMESDGVAFYNLAFGDWNEVT